MRRLTAGIALMFLVLSLNSSSAASREPEKRVALVIGNSSYEFTSPLANPRNDAADVGTLLKKLGFEVVSGTDLNKTAMEKVIRSFAEKMTGAKLGVFFYAGHGLQVGGKNYLVPIDAKLTTAIGLDFEMVSLDLVHRTMEQQSPTNVLFLDACRDNPLARNLARALGTRSASIGRGLAAVESGEGTLISFSTQPGNVALDGGGRNSPFARALVRHLDKPGEDLSSILINVRNDVMSATGRRQVPWDHSALTAHVYMAAPPVPKAPAIPYKEQVELSLWEAVKGTDSQELLRSYLDRYPDGKFATQARSLIDQLEKEAREEQIAAEKEAELRRAEAAKAAALLAKVESERKAALAKQADELKRAREEARKAREALAKAEQERIAARQAAEAAKDSANAAEKEAELRKAEAAKSAALRAKFISERNAALAKQADELNKAREEARKAREALAKAEAERLAAKEAAAKAREKVASTKKDRVVESKKPRTTTARKVRPARQSSGGRGGGKCFTFSGKTFCE
ncbi:MAG: hypothetical protein RLZ98_1482 [Pseudomonadota bacterium]|jgi:uncharacterized caspase-like protein